MSALLERPLQSPEKLLTAEEFFLMPLQRAELVEGKVIEMTPPGGAHGRMAVKIASRLESYVEAENLGMVFVESGFRLRRNPDVVRSPDVSFVEYSRLPNGRAPRGFIEGAPTIAVEIVSPNDLWREVEEKVGEYIEAGAKLVWIVEPEKGTVTVRSGETSQRLHRADTLRADEVLPNFQLALENLFETISDE